MTTTRLVIGAGVRDMAGNRWLGAYFAAFFLVAESLFWFGGTGPQVVLSLLNVVLMVVPLVSLVFGAMHLYASRDFVELLLAQPVRRRELFTGLYLGLAVPLTAAFVLGAGIPVLMNLGSSTGLGAVAALLLAGSALTFAFVAVATWIALRTDDRLKGIGMALAVWLGSSLLYDGAVLAFASAFGDWPIEKVMLGLMGANPVDLARVLVLAQVDASALMGYTGALFERTFGTALGTVIAITGLVCWCAGPWLLAARRFDARDF
jgi:Cu-processing system permease protein